MLNRKLLSQYNRADSLLFIASYPEKSVTYSNKVCAVGGFTKNTLLALNKGKAKTPQIVITVMIGEKEEVYVDNGVLVLRLISRNNPLSYLKVMRAIGLFTRVKQVIVEFEFGSFGGLINTTFFLSVLSYLKLVGKNTQLVMHQVVDNLDNLAGHLGWQKKTLKTTLFNTGLRKYYLLMSWLVERIIVTEKVFSARLRKAGVSETKLCFIPHGVDTEVKSMAKSRARQLLKLPKRAFIIMYFGYLTWYKGADIFLEAARVLQKKGKFYFVMAGGTSFSNKSKEHYKTYLKQFASLPDNLRLTGFVPERELAAYFAAADLIVLPYRTMMSSSGPLSLSFTFKKPVLLSSSLRSYLHSPDLALAFKEVGLTRQELFFETSRLPEVLKTLKANQLRKLTLFSQKVRSVRSYAKIVSRYLS